MDPHDTTVSNADIWTRYFQQQWSPWLAPFGERTPVSEWAEGTAARVAGLFTLFAAGPIAWLYTSRPMHAEAAIEAVRPSPERGTFNDEGLAA